MWCTVITFSSLHNFLFSSLPSLFCTPLSILSAHLPPIVRRLCLPLIFMSYSNCTHCYYHISSYDFCFIMQTRTRTHNTQCRRRFPCGGQDQGSSEIRRHHHLGSSGHFQIVLPDGHHLLPLRLSELLHEVWLLDLWQSQDWPCSHWVKGERQGPGLI